MRPLSCLATGLFATAMAGASAAAPAATVLSSGPFTSAAGSPLALGAQATDASVEKAARAIVLDRASSTAELGKGLVVELSRGERIVRLPQMHRGLPVALAGATVTFGKDGVGRRLAARMETDLPGDTTPSLDASAAAKIAAARSGLAAKPADATLAIWPTPSGGKLAWVVVPARLAGLPYAPVVVVDARAGDVLLAYDAATSLHAAQVYPSNPVKSPELIDVTLAVGEDETTLTSPLLKAHNCVDLKSVKQIFGYDVHTCDLLQTAVADEVDGDFLLYTPAADTAPEDEFSEVSIFYHANRAYDLFRSWQPDFKVQGGPLDCVANLMVPQGFDTFNLNKMKDPELPLVPFQNAFFSPSNPIFSSVFGLDGAAMWFGQGPKRDFSYDGDVVYHEFGHAVVNATIKLVGFPRADDFGLSYAPGAMNEGLADYFSSALTGDPDVGEYAVGDFAPGQKGIRSLDDDDACPTAIAGEVHKDATLFSGALWDVRVTLGDQTDELDRAVFQAMNEAPTGDLGYEDLAKLLVAAVKDSALGAAVADALSAAFAKRGVLPQCTRVLEYAGKAMNGPLQTVWIAPGVDSTTINKPPYAPGVVQVHRALAGDTTSLWVEVQQVQLGGGGLGQQGTPASLKVLVGFGKAPLTFSYSPFAVAGETVVVDLTKEGNKLVGSAEVPAGAIDAHVMIVNVGGLDGAYTALSIDTVISPRNPDETTGAGGGGGAGGDDGPKAEDSVEIGGCGCSVPGPAGTGVGSTAAAALAWLLVARRRRRA